MSVSDIMLEFMCAASSVAEESEGDSSELMFLASSSDSASLLVESIALSCALLIIISNDWASSNAALAEA